MNTSSQKTENRENSQFHWTDKVLGILVLTIIMFVIIGIIGFVIFLMKETRFGWIVVFLPFCLIAASGYKTMIKNAVQEANAESQKNDRKQRKVSVKQKSSQIESLEKDLSDW